MSSRIGPETRTYNVRSPGGGVYRVRLMERSGADSAELFFTGERYQHSVKLCPGDYWAIVVDVATGAASGRIPVTLGDPDQPVILAGAAPAKAPASIAAAPPGIRASAAAVDRRNSTLNWHKTELAATLAPPSRTAAGGSFRRFDIGISEDRAPASIGGWQAPAGLLMQVTHDDGAAGLQVHVRDSQPVRKSRVRMSIGLEGLPTIRVPLPLYRQGIIVTIRPAATAEDEFHELDLMAEVTAADPTVQALVAALTELSSDEAMSVLNWATDGSAEYAVAFLASKVNDLWAATAAAVLLVKIGRYQHVANWLKNLARLAPHIADAAVVAAWGTVAGDTEAKVEAVEEEAMSYLARAGRIGAPNYTVANSLNLELLSSLRATGLDRKVRRAAAEEHAKAALRSRFRLYKSPYMIWEEAREKLQGGRLPGDLYLPVAHGMLTGEGLKLPVRESSERPLTL